MDAFLIVTAILLSVVLLFRYAVPIGKPQMRLGERLSDSALKNKFALLGKSCAVTRHGFGIYYRYFDVKKILRNIRKKYQSGIKLYAWERELLNSESLLNGAWERALDTVRLSYTLGHVFGMPRIYLFCSELVKSRNGDVGVKSMELALEAFEANARLTDYERKSIHGMIVFCICGLLCAVAAKAVIRDKSYRRGKADGIECKIDLDGIRDNEYLSGVIDSVSREERGVIDGIAENNGVDCDFAYSTHKMGMAEVYATVKASVRAVKLFDKLQISDERHLSHGKKTVSKRTVGFFNIMPIALTLTTAVFVCIFVPTRYFAVVFVAAIIFYGCFRLPMLLNAPNYYCVDFSALIERLHMRRKTTTVAFSNDSEIAYFGDEPKYLFNTTNGMDKLVCDNRGTIRMGNENIEIFFEYNGKRRSLCDFDGIALHGKTIYRIFDGAAEICLELTSAVDCSGLMARITTINRTDARLSTDVSCGVKLRTNCVFGINLGNKEFYNSIGKVSLNAEPFSSAQTMLVVALGGSVAEVKRIFDHVSCDGMFEYTSDCMSVFCDADLPCGVTPNRRLWRGEDFARSTRCDDSANVDNLSRNILLSKNVAVELDAMGVKRIYLTNSNKDIVPPDDNEKVYLLFGENKVLCSPFGEKCKYYKSSIGSVAYYCVLDDCVCKTTCVSDGIGGFLFDITVKNMSDIERKIDIMFGATALSGSNIICEQSKITAANGHESFSVMCSRRYDEYAICKEGWYIRGQPNRTCGFRAGGSTPAVVMHVRSEPKPYETDRILFRLSTANDRVPDPEFVAQCYDLNAEFARRFERITLCSSDPDMNTAFGIAMYRSYTFGIAHDKQLSVREKCAILCCSDYVDTQSTRKRLLELLNKCRGYNMHDRLLCVYTVAHYVRLSGDCDFLCERIMFNGGAACSVRELCLNMLDCYVPSECASKVETLVFNKIFIETCEFFMRACNDYVRIGGYKRVIDYIYSQNLHGSFSCEYCSDSERLLYCAMLYNENKFDKAFEILSGFTKNTVDGSNIEAHDLAVYCLLIIEKLCGIKLCGNRVKISPRIADNCPHIEYKIKSDERGTAHVIIDEKIKYGEWRMRVGSVAYALDGFKISDGEEHKVVFYRSGIHR